MNILKRKVSLILSIMMLALAIFFQSVSSDNGDKSKNELHQTKKLLHSKGNYQQDRKTTY